ncbi:MAG: hypothetical protein M3419_07310, partial [Actinomycetota bacterium]|nr:hypothetical protein [Actinomycetota bacterium]
RRRGAVTPAGADAHRQVLVAPERLAGWIERFAGRHGTLRWRPQDGRTALVAADGAAASFRLPAAGPPATDVDTLVARAVAYTDFGLVLVRRGGFAVGNVVAAELVASRCGTRYVQGQTKAGGWSQQRYARRRANQADALVGAAAQAVTDVLAGTTGDLVCGGDRPLVRQVLEVCRLSGALDRARPDWLEIGEPRRRVLQDGVTKARSVRIELNAKA